MCWSCATAFQTATHGRPGSESAFNGFELGHSSDYAEANVCREIIKLHSSDGYAPWNWADISHARKHLPAHLWHAVALALYTGQRQADVLQMTWNRLRDGGIEIRQGKTRKRLGLPLHRDLREILETIPKLGRRFSPIAAVTPGRQGFRHPGQRH